MSGRQKNVVNDKPFDKKLLSKAAQAVNEYRFAFWREDSRHVGQCIEMDTLGTGKTVDKCIAEARSLAITGVAVMLESGKRPPLPSSPHISRS